MHAKEYHDAIKDINFSHDFQQRTINAMQNAPKTRRRHGLLCTAAAAAAAVAVTLTALSLPIQGPNGPTSPLSAYALSTPTYPELPPEPQFQDGMDYDKYYQDLVAYDSVLRQFRGEGGLSDKTKTLLNDFSARSTPLALTGLDGKNAVFSPLSLWSALALLARCTHGESRQQVLHALGVDNVEQADQQVDQLWKKLYTDDGMSSLLFANSVWLNECLDGTYVQSTLDSLAKMHYAGSYAIPMGTADADWAVSQWVSDQTKGLIGTDQPVTKTAPETLALLASSLYYKAAWFDEFNAVNNTMDSFSCAGGSKRTVEFMHKTVNANFLCRDGYQAARLSTKLGPVTFVLPDKGISPEQLLQQPDFLSSLNSSSKDALYGEVRWSLPKFDADSRLELKDTLKAMGVTDAFDADRADLSQLTTLSAVVSSVDQLARVKADEKGVEAAAVTLITADATSAPSEPENICIMDLDRPFLFVIECQDIPLFVGVINQV